MHGELVEIKQFMQRVRPFDELPEETFDAFIKKITIKYYKRGTHILKSADANQFLYIIRTGAVDIHDAKGDFTVRSTEHECFAFRSLIRKKPLSNNVFAHEDTLAYLLPATIFYNLCEQFDFFNDYFILAEAQRLKKAMRGFKRDNFQFHSRHSQTIFNILKRKPITSKADITIQAAAKIMSTHDISSLLMVDNDDNLIGLITDSDLRNLVVANNLDPKSPASEIMTTDLIAIDQSTIVFEAELKMMQNNIHHLPVLDNHKAVGIVTTTDLLKLFNQSPIHAVSEIKSADSIEQLKKLSQKIPEIFCQLVDSGLASVKIGQIMSTLGEAINIKLIAMAEQKLGKAPVDYCWLTAGSLGRQEQLLHSDQDNVLLLSNDYDETKHKGYFTALSKFVCDGLDQCGYIYCPGNVMASNPQWCQPLDIWKQYFTKWMNDQDPKSILYCSIFFDMRFLSGNNELFKDLQNHYLSMVKDKKLFLSHLAMNTLAHTPPIGFFRRLVLISDKEHRNLLNLKNRGTVPIIDMARIYVLSAGLSDIGTYDRIVAIKNNQLLTEEDSDNLLDAYDFINQFRIEHQSRQIKAGLPADNFANPETLSAFERDHLRDAFKIVAQTQQYLLQRFTSPNMR